MFDTHLILADGTCFQGRGFGAKAPSIQELLSFSYESAPMGEVIFNTTMGAYAEIITDSSYAGQIIVMTAPHIGNYGMDASWYQMLKEQPFCRALVVRDVYEGPLLPNRTKLSTQLEQWGICGMTEVDTRSLTLHIRNHGFCYAALVSAPAVSRQEIAKITGWLAGCPPMEKRNFVDITTSKSKLTYMPSSQATHRYAVIDYGIKRSIIEQLLARNVQITLFPATVTADELLKQDTPFDAVFLSNGPGDPAILSFQVAQIERIIGSIPLLGICLGHQLASLALGARTYKMKFGHHGGNHPVRDLETGRVFVTAQNHGYCVDADSLPHSTCVWMINDNDQTVEGIYDKTQGVMTVQFHPEAAPGPREARSLFDTYIAFADVKKDVAYAPQV